MTQANPIFLNGALISKVLYAPQYPQYCLFFHDLGIWIFQYRICMSHNHSHHRKKKIFRAAKRFMTCTPQVAARATRVKQRSRCYHTPTAGRRHTNNNPLSISLSFAHHQLCLNRACSLQIMAMHWKQSKHMKVSGRLGAYSSHGRFIYVLQH